MCGGCGRVVATDEWSATLAGRRARWEAARLVNQVLEDGDHPARVSCGPSGFTVRTATGGGALADTASELWRVLLSLPGPALHPQPVLDRVPRTPVTDAVAAAARAAGTVRTAEGRTPS